MKYLFSVLAVVFMFGSCALYQYTDIPHFDTIEEAHRYVANDIEYVIDPIGWKYPEETV